MTGRSLPMSLAYWVVTGLFCLLMAFNAYAFWRVPEVAQMFDHLGYPGYFRHELAVANLLGVLALLCPVPARVREWAYAGFAFNLLFALLAHRALGDGPAVWGWAAGACVLWGISYGCWRLRSAHRAPDGGMVLVR